MLQTNEWIILAFALLSALVFGLSFMLPHWKRNWSNINGNVNSNGMTRLFMFNSQPYIAVVYLTIGFLLAIATSAITLFALGAIGYGLLWLIKLILWAIIIIGWIALVGGILATLGKEFSGIIFAVAGGVIVAYQDELSDWGNACVDAGFNFYNALNLWELCQNLFNEYILTILIIAAIPLVIGIIAAVLVLLCAFIFWAVETVMTRKYNIKHPCPFCHEPSEPAVYLSEYIPLPVKLRPGVYGLFHITHPQTGEDMPTMLLNGRDSLTRRCPHCERTISYKTGVEKHIAIVGLPESGKTCLTHRLVGNLMRKYPDVQFTDDINPEAKRIILGIKNGKDQDLASKTSINDLRRSLQILVPGAASLPYHLFINDVGGELFTNSGVDSTHMQFFKDVESITVLIDPMTMNVSEFPVSGHFKEWVEQNMSKMMIGGDARLLDVFQNIKSITLKFGKKTQNIHLNIVLVKSDLGYIPSNALNDENRLRQIVEAQMGLEAEIHDLEQSYATIRFFAVSALKNQGVDQLNEGILNSLNVKQKNN